MTNSSTITSSKSLILKQEGEEAQTLLTNESAIGVRYDDMYITPGYVEFTEAIEGVTYHQRIIIKNAGNKPALIRIHPANSIAFQVKAPRSGMRVNPGLNATACVTYTFKRPSVLRAIIPIEINGKVFDYRAMCTLAVERISIEPKSIDFGIIDINYSSGFKIITIRNEGGKSTRFSIDLGQNDLDITVKPFRGVVRPQKQVTLHVELIGTHEGIFYSEFWIKSVPNICVPVKVNVIVPQLVVYHPNTTGDFTLIDFPSTIESTSRYDTFVLRNLSSRASSYVVLGELDNEVKCFRDVDRKRYPTYSAFEIRPIEGRMEPFQGIIFEVQFSPTIKLSQRRQKCEQWAKRGNDYQKSEADFMVFLRIVKVHCIESEDFIKVDPMKDSTHNVLSQKIYIQEAIMETPSPSMSSISSCTTNTDIRTHDVIRLCLYGEVEAARLCVEPNILYFGDLLVDQTSQRVLRLTNPSAVAPIYLEYVPNATARCCPSWMRLKSKASIEVLVKVRGKENDETTMSDCARLGLRIVLTACTNYNVEPSFKLYFSVIVDSYELIASRRCLRKVKIGTCSIECIVNVILKSKQGYLSKRSLPLKDSTNDEVEIMKRVLRPPIWKYKDYSEAVDRLAVCARRPQLEKSISKAAVLIPLSPLQIYNVHIRPTRFIYGMVAPHSFNYRQLIIRNTNNIPVMIRLISSTKHIRFPEGDLIILQPDSTMTRLVEYHASDVGKFNGYIGYVINNNHFFDLSVNADIVRKQLYLDKREIELGKEWSNEEAYRPIASIVRITNKLSAETYFRWEIPATSGFYVEPTSGYVRGNATLYVYAYYVPDNAKANYAQAMMKCESGSCASLQLGAPRFALRVEFVNDNTNLGEIPLNLPTKVIAVLQNFEFNEVMYEVDGASLIRGCDVNPLRGKIPPRGIAILEVHLTIDVCCRFSTTIATMIQGGRRLLYKINGEVSFPRLKILPQQIDMKRISADAFQTHQITAMNIGATILRLQFLLEEYPEFRISLSPDRKNSDIDTEGVTIVPGASRSLYLHFQPVDLASYAFYLPIVVNQLLGPASMSNSSSVRPCEYLKSRETHYAHLGGFVVTSSSPDKLPTVAIDCTVVARVVFFNKLLFRFNVETNELSEELRIENRLTPREIAVSINVEELSQADCPFTIEWSRGAEVRRTFDSIECTLHPGECVFFALEFKPKKCGAYSAEAPIRVRGELDGGVFNKLQLDGEFPAAAIDVEPTEIYFTPVPLGTAIEEKFKIRAKHFDNVAFIRPNFSTASRCSGDYKHELLRVEFPHGSTVPPHSYVELEARIIFKSDQSVSFCSMIEFRDDNALATCSLTVYATADTSLLTTYKYLAISSVSDDISASNRHFEKRLSHSSTSLDDEMDNEDCDNGRRISHTPKNRELSESRSNVTSYFNDRSKSCLRQVIDSKFDLLWNEEINVNNGEIDDRNTQIEENQMAKDNGKRISICKRESTFSVDCETKNHKHSEKSHLYCPTSDQNDHWEKCVRSIMTTVEEWMYSGPLRFHFYPDIPVGVTAAFSNYCVKKKVNMGNSKRKSNATIPSFIDVLESLVGPKLRSYLGEFLRQSLPEDDIERINYVLQLYDKTLDFLLFHGAHLVHVSAQFLLNYDDYLISIDVAQNNASYKTRRKKSYDTSGTQCERSRRLFESRSKQYWLDVVLQTYKCFVLAGIHKHEFRTRPSFAARSSRRPTVYRESIVSSISSSPRQYELHETAIRGIVDLLIDRPAVVGCPEERFLLAWLQYHYEQQRMRDWMTDRRVNLNPRERQDVAESRSVRNFHGDLSDSLVLIAVTVAYCPFLVSDYFNNLYVRPRSNGEVLHNAVALVTAWRKIRLGFAITPMQLVNPNQLQILMLVVHLFQVLPTYVPRAKITLSCPLAQVTTKQISVSNPTDNTVNYLLLFVNNSNGFFTILKPASILRLNAHDSGQVKIQFHARKIRKSKVYLLLCGCAIGPHFGRNQIIILEGCIDNLRIANEYNIRSKLYEIFETSVRVDVPYRNAAEYNIWMTEEPPSQPATLKMTQWCKLRIRKIPRRLFLNQRSIVVAEGASEAHLSISMACIAPKQRSFWLIFQSNTGDFIIQINSTWQASVNDRIIVEWSAQGDCICSDRRGDVSGTCPFNISVPVPSRNAQFWRCVLRMFQKTLDSKERLFWSKYLDTYIGLRLIRWLMGDNTDSAAMEFIHIFDTSVTYKVAISEKSSPLIVPECCITIQEIEKRISIASYKWNAEYYSYRYLCVLDVRPPNEQVPMIVHISPTTPSLYTTKMTLTSLNDQELRVYTIDYLRS